MKVLALCLASLLVAQAAARRGLVEAYQQPRRQLLDALLPGLAAAAAPASERGGSRGAAGSAARRSSSSSGELSTALAFGDAVVACREWQPDSLEWDWPSNPTEYSAVGKAVPPTADVKKLNDAICSDPVAAGDQIRAAVDKGGADAQAAVFALFAADCEDEEASSDAFGAVIDAVNSGDPADIDAVSSWFEQFVEAADAVGIPVCLSLAVIDLDTAEATDERFFHTTGPGPAGTRRGRSSGSGASTGGAGSSGSGGGDSSSGAASDGTIGSGLGSLNP